MLLLILGRHIGHFSHMVQEMQLLNPLSVLQVEIQLLAYSRKSIQAMNILVCFPESVYSFISLSLSLQVSGKLELEKALIEFFTDEAVLEARRKAAKEAFNHLSSDIIGRIWSSLEFHIFSKLLRD